MSTAWSYCTCRVLRGGGFLSEVPLYATSLGWCYPVGASPTVGGTRRCHPAGGSTVYLLSLGGVRFSVEGERCVVSKGHSNFHGARPVYYDHLDD